LVSLNSTLGQPENVNPVATISPATALSAIQKYPGYRKQLKGLVPPSLLLFPGAAGEVASYIHRRGRSGRGRVKGERQDGLSPLHMDYVVEAHAGSVIAELPRTPSVVAIEKAEDAKKQVREIGIESSGGKKLLKDTNWNVQTYDFDYKRSSG
jgi:bacillolysin/neutral peptidase B